MTRASARGDASPTTGILPAADSIFDWSSGDVDRAFRRLSAVTSPADLCVVWLGNHTLDPMVRYATVIAASYDLHLNNVIGPYDQLFQELLSEDSATLSASPGAIVLSLSLRKFSPLLVEGGANLSRESTDTEIRRITRALDEWVQVATNRTDAHLFVCNFSRPPSLRFGIADTSLGMGEQFIYSELNSRLAALAADNPRVTIIDAAHAATRAGTHRNWNPRMYRLAKIEWEGGVVAHLAAFIARACRALVRPARKCIVLDLDNTLWGGILGEEGPERIRINEGDPIGESFRAFQRALLDMKSRGILLAICSKNNREDVEEAFRVRDDMPLRLADFSCTAINWEPKHANIASIAETLNIGTDSLAFVDDNPAECELVRQMMPEVLTLQLPRDPAVYADLLYEMPDFDKLRLTREDLAKSEQYAANFAREEHRQLAGDMAGFLESLGTEVQVRPAEKGDLTRVQQLFAKTNQFNVTTIRYTASEIQHFIDDQNCIIDVISAKDRFGDLGLIGVYVVRFVGTSAHIDSFVMSCRALGRGIETAAYNVLRAQVFRNASISRLTGTFSPTKKMPLLKFEWVVQ